MKKVVGYALAFTVGSIISGSTAFAASTYVQALKGTSTVQVDGKTVAAPPKLVYDDTTYVQLYSIQQGLAQVFGTKPSWDGSNFNIITSSTAPSSPIGVSALPYTVTFSDGMKLTVNKVTATDSSTIINVTVANVGNKTGVDAIESPSTISDGGPQVTFVSQDDTFYQGALEPGESVTGDITYTAMLPGTTKFTWYVIDFSYGQHAISFDLTK